MLDFLRFLPWPRAKSGPALEPTYDRPFCFLHVPKTAGSTVRQFLLTRLPPGEACVVQGMPTEELWEAHRRRPYLAYLGHVPHRLIRGLPGPPHVFTVLRDPVDRVLSHYYFLRQRLVAPTHSDRSGDIPREVGELEIGEFLRREPDRSRVIFGELQTRMLADHRAGWQLGDYDPACSPPPLTRADLELAKEHIRGCVIVGLSHRLLESLQLLCEAFGWPPPDGIGHVNRTVTRPKQRQLAPDTLRALAEMTAFDRELFEEGARLFERQWSGRHRRRWRRAAAPTPFSRELERGSDRSESGSAA